MYEYVKKELLCNANEKAPDVQSGAVMIDYGYSYFITTLRYVSNAAHLRKNSSRPDSPASSYSRSKFVTSSSEWTLISKPRPLMTGTFP